MTDGGRGNAVLKSANEHWDGISSPSPWLEDGGHDGAPPPILNPHLRRQCAQLLQPPPSHAPRHCLEKRHLVNGGEKQRQHLWALGGRKEFPGST